MVIDEALVRELLDRTEDTAALVLMEGRARIAGPAELDSDTFRGAAVLVSRGELVDRLGTSAPTPQAVQQLAASLRDAVGKLGA
ncbi:hypothetical protein ABZ371_16185 [Streptomyces sp. NPDC005899]|uniref:hypothetical protein n=1 Tax=Streptomyces sp. NPDC005899 TaxID=3155716 RepID=UPI0033F6630B